MDSNRSAAIALALSFTLLCHGCGQSEVTSGADGGKADGTGSGGRGGGASGGAGSGGGGGGGGGQGGGGVAGGSGGMGGSSGASGIGGAGEGDGNSNGTAGNGGSGPGGRDSGIGGAGGGNGGDDNGAGRDGGTGGAGGGNVEGVPCRAGSEPCGPNKFCELPPGSCSNTAVAGTCVDVPNICPGFAAPVCGCDGKTYGNDCERQHFEVQPAHEGRCVSGTPGPGPRPGE